MLSHPTTPQPQLLCSIKHVFMYNECYHTPPHPNPNCCVAGIKHVFMCNECYHTPPPIIKKWNRTISHHHHHHHHHHQVHCKLKECKMAKTVGPLSLAWAKQLCRIWPAVHLSSGLMIGLFFRRIGQDTKFTVLGMDSSYLCSSGAESNV